MRAESIIDVEAPESLLPIAEEKMKKIAVDFLGAKEAVMELRLLVLMRQLAGAGICKGDTVICKQQSGEELAIYEGIERHKWQPMRHVIILRGFTKRGKPRVDGYWIHSRHIGCIRLPDKIKT